MNWDDARVFLAVARSGQILGAAQRLSLNHATVARRISALEAALQAKLIDRRTTGCALTSEGERFFEFAESMETEMLSARAEIGGTDVELSGAVRIGTPDGFGVAFLAPRLGALNERYPDLTLQLVPLHRAFSLSKREADLAVTVGQPDHGRLVSRKLTDYTLGLYASRTYAERYGLPQSEEELKQHRLIGYVDDLIYAPSLNYCAEFSKDWQSRLECASALGQTEAVRAGSGIGILHGFIADGNDDFVPVLPEKRISRSYYLVTHESARHLRRIKAVSDFIFDLVKQEKDLFMNQQ
ncbi:LysR family transcriptional regulator [Pseudovibrio japonicus]|uniref:LysR family transcriptional regulator n=1 Tax=Pseudovibrio japonicus TaxID=366534 RepID=A0ABQ3DX43_9HYPH|nr:LysR family transcriptional regulator [Pseudovibrio japonicus]GHB19090.1 LysR family transcriptional regulator [Pseudovibrio japonicus]